MGLKKYNTKLYEILQLTMHMPENLQEVLLAQARKIADKRTIERNPCLIYANYKIEKHADSGFILDINSYGAHIETNVEFELGDSIILTFNSPFTCQKIGVSGKITWGICDRAGIRFNYYFPTQREFDDFITELFGERDLEIKYSSFVNELFAKLKPGFKELLH
jgi:hypothetical protein